MDQEIVLYIHLSEGPSYCY